MTALRYAPRQSSVLLDYCLVYERGRTTYRHNIRISRDNNIMQIDLSGGINKISMFIWAMFGVFRFGTALIR